MFRHFNAETPLHRHRPRSAMLEHNLPRRGSIDDYLLALLELALQQLHRQFVLDFALDCALQGPRAVGRVEALFSENVLGGVGQLDLDPLVRQPLGQVAELDLDYLS